MDADKALADWSPAFTYDAGQHMRLTAESYRMLRCGIEAAIAQAVLAERHACAVIAANACLVPPDGGSPTEDERIVCERAADFIIARSRQEQ